jgi:cob(I)alamin adenosyltransferase
MAIRLTKIYTRGGDKGLTGLVGGKRVPKESLRLEAYGTTDELNAVIGIVRTHLQEFEKQLGDDYDGYAEMLRRVQNELFDVGSELASPPEAAHPEMHHMSEAEVGELEAEIDRMNGELEPLKSFCLPGGGLLNAYLHLARTVCRRAERACWRLSREEPLNDHLIIYLNRLSDHLFVQSRWVAKRLNEPEYMWDRGLRIDPRMAREARRKAQGKAESEALGE